MNASDLQPFRASQTPDHVIKTASTLRVFVCDQTDLAGLLPGQIIRPARRQRGSAIMLALITIVMMVMLGAAYLQVARTDRRTAVEVDTRIEIDESSILLYLGQILAEDANITTGLDEGGQEPYDYPWTVESRNRAATLTASATATPGQRLTNRLWYVGDRFAPTVVPGPVPYIDTSNPDDNDPAVRPPRAFTAIPDARDTDAAGTGHYHAEGNWGDDPWLASNEPVELSPGQFYWPHITNLSGVFLDLDPATLVADPASNTGEFPRQYLSTADDDSRSGDTNAVPAVSTADLSVDEYKFADADGDGIYDSRWTWAPVPADNGVAFVIATRIIDNSALVDLNTWSYRGSDFDTESPRWLWPGELDLESSIALVTSVAGVGAVTADDIMTSDPNGTPYGRGMTTNHDTFDSRLYNWLNASAIWRDVNGTNSETSAWEFIGDDLEQAEAQTPGSSGPTAVNTGETTTDPSDTYGRFNAWEDETELRWRNGVTRAITDNSEQADDTPVESLDANLFRTTTPLIPELAWDDAAGFSPEDVFLLEEPRKKLTTAAGSASYGTINVNAVSINTDFDEGLDALVEGFRDDISFDRTAVLSGSTLDEAPDLLIAGGWLDENDWADQAAAIVKDFIDGDYIVSARENNTAGRDDHYGMEYLPIVCEAYVQAEYQNTAGDTFDPQWDYTDGDFGVAIQIVNPWPWRIRLPEDVIRLVVVDDSGNEEDWGSLTDMFNDMGTDPEFMEANELIVIYQTNPVGPNTEVSSTTGLADIPSFEVTGKNWPTTNTREDAFIELRAATTESDFADAPANWDYVTYQRFRMSTFDNSVLQTHSALVTANAIGYFEYHGLGTANGLNALTVREDDVDIVSDPTPATSATSTENHIQDIGFQASSGMWDQHLKGATSPAADAVETDLDARVRDLADVTSYPVATTPPTTTTPGHEPWIIPNAGRMYRSGELLRVAFLGPRKESTGDAITVADVWHEFAEQRDNDSLDPYTVSSLKMNIVDPGDPTATASTVLLGDTSRVAKLNSDGVAVSHAAYYINRFETITVNDGDDGLVAGRPNINTMSEDMLAAVLPVFDNAARAEIAADIIAFREDLNTYSGSTANYDIKGIAFPGQLATDITNTTDAANQSVYDPTGTNPSYTVLNQALDFNELDALAGFTPYSSFSHDDDGYANDREEKTMLTNYLNQVVSTRSDIFTAYVLVRAYPANDFSNNNTGDPLDEFRLIAVFDRSSINDNGFPRILAVKRIDKDDN